MATTYVCGYWKIDENAKHNYHSHYKQLFKNTFEILKGCKIVFFYDDDDVLIEIKKHVQTNDIIYLKRYVERLHTFDLSQSFLETCKKQDNKRLVSINKVNEKGLVHYEREYKRSGEHGFRKVFTVWTSKLFLVNEMIKSNYFNTENFAWIDVSISRFTTRDTTKYTQYYPPHKLFYFSDNVMKYYGIRLPILACFLIAHSNVWKELIPLYEEKMISLKNSQYAHDEETILYLVMKERLDMFCDIKDM